MSETRNVGESGTPSMSVPPVDADSLPPKEPSRWFLIAGWTMYGLAIIDGVVVGTV
jgi:hypothetical protein